MPNLPKFPAGASPEPQSGHEPLEARPRSIRIAVMLIWGAVGLTVLWAVVSFLNLDSAVDAVLEADTNELTRDQARQAVISFIAVVLVIGGGTTAALAVLVNKGKSWARIVYTGLAAVILLFAVLTLLGGQLIAVVLVALIAATLYFLWQRESTAWLTGRPVA